MPCTRTEEIAKSHWLMHETDAEHADRVEGALVSASMYFDQATKLQLQDHRQTMADIRPYSGAPKWDRMKAEADKRWTDSTFPARELFFVTFEELMRDGEVSEATSYMWDDLLSAQTHEGWKRLDVSTRAAERLGVRIVPFPIALPAQREMQGGENG